MLEYSIEDFSMKLAIDKNAVIFISYGLLQFESRINVPLVMQTQ